MMPDSTGAFRKTAQVIDIIDTNSILISVDMDKHIKQLMDVAIDHGDAYCSIHRSGLGYLKENEIHAWQLRDTETIGVENV